MDFLYQVTFKKQIDFLKNHIKIQGISMYISKDHYKQLNKALCDGSTLTDNQKLIVDSMSSIFSSIPTLYHPIILYRAINAENLNEHRLECQYISTSLDQHEPIAKYIGSTCCLLKIFIPQGSRIIPVAFLDGAVQHEYEVILPINGKYTLNHEILEYIESKLLRVYYISYSR